MYPVTWIGPVGACGASPARAVVPIDVKAGTTGTLKSLPLLMALRQLPSAVRFNAERPSRTPVDHQTTPGAQATESLVSLPFSLAGHTHRLIEAVMSG